MHFERHRRHTCTYDIFVIVAIINEGRTDGTRQHFNNENNSETWVKLEEDQGQRSVRWEESVKSLSEMSIIIDAVVHFIIAVTRLRWPTIFIVVIKWKMTTTIIIIIIIMLIMIIMIIIITISCPSLLLLVKITTDWLVCVELFVIFDSRTCFISGFMLKTANSQSDQSSPTLL